MKRKSSLDCPKGQFGPVYNINAGATFRRREEPLREWSYAERRAYGATIEAAVLAAQASALRRVVSEPRPICASQSWANEPGEVGDVVRRQQAASLAACPAQVRRARSPHEWEQLYVEHMTTQCGPDWKPSWERADLEAKCAADPQAVAAELLEAA